ncbi:hypothetical protein ACQ0QQ_04940 [Lysinibacillus sphaericus]
MAGAAGRYSFIAEAWFGRRGGGVKMDWLTQEDQQFVNEVVEGLKGYGVRSKDREKVKLQIAEHIQESREYGNDGVEEFGDAETFIKDYLEINEIDVHSRIKKNLKSNKGAVRTILPAIFGAIVIYVMSQLIFSLFLTEAFNPLSTPDFKYNLLYRISGNSWWNSFLIMISLGIAVIAGFLIQTASKRSVGA